MIDNIREAILELEGKNYKIDEILISGDILELLESRINRFIGVNIKLDSTFTLFGYEAAINVFDNNPVVFRTSIKIEDILGSDKK